MLILTRKRDEKVVCQPSPNLIDAIRRALGEAPLEQTIEAYMALDVLQKPVTITCVAIRGDKIRLGFDADKQIVVHRQEIIDAIQRDNVAHPNEAM